MKRSRALLSLSFLSFSLPLFVQARSRVCAHHYKQESPDNYVDDRAVLQRDAHFWITLLFFFFSVLYAFYASLSCASFLRETFAFTRKTRAASNEGKVEKEKTNPTQNTHVVLSIRHLRQAHRRHRDSTYYNRRNHVTPYSRVSKGD